jgi:alpha-glucoside transport system substrate-binding protein
MHRRVVVRSLATASAVALLSTSCLSEGGDAGGGGGGGNGDNSVEVMYAFSGPDSQYFQAGLKDFLAKEGITVKFSSTPDFDKLIRSRVAGNNIPDIAVFPQPGIALDIAKSGKLADLSTVIDDFETYKSNTVLLDAGTSDDGKVYAAPYKVAVKSLVWYPKKAFADAGYTVPKTQAELLMLTEKIKADGRTPWCVGIEAAAASGWAATDWMEDYILRFGGPEKYDQWVKHEIPFTDPVVKQAADEIAKIWFPEGNVLGGRKAIASTPVTTAGNPMFQPTPKCFLHRQSSFLALPGSFPADVVANLDERAGIFPLPPIEAGEQPVLGAGDLAGLFSQDDEAAKKVLNFIVSKEMHELVVPNGGFISPHKDFDLSKQPSQTMRDISEIAYSATAFKFDGSDLMPGEVGAGSFWRGMVSWATGQKDTDAVLEEIEASWPKS